MEDKLEIPCENEADVGTRLDVFLARNVPNCSRRKAQDLIESRSVLVNGRHSGASTRIDLGDVVTLLKPPSDVRARPELAAQEGSRLGDVRIVFDDPMFAVLEKPRGMHSVTLSNDDELTLADCVAHLFPSSRELSGDPREAGLVQRLDYWTSGLILNAKSRDGLLVLRELLFKQEIEKHYLAIVDGELRPRRQEISLPILSQGQKVRVYDKETGGAQPALTIVSLLASNRFGKEQFSLCSATAASARRHQVRAHFAAIGHPLVGDTLYDARTELSQVLHGVLSEGFFLNAWKISMTHPETKERLHFQSSEPILKHVAEAFSYDLLK